MNERTLDLLHLFGGDIAQSAVQTDSTRTATNTEAYEIDRGVLQKTLRETFPMFSGEYYHLEEEEETRVGRNGLKRLAVNDPDGIGREYDWIIWSDQVPENTDDLDPWMGTTTTTTTPPDPPQTKPKLLALQGQQQPPNHDPNSPSMETQLRKSLDLSWKFTLVYTGVSPERLLEGYTFDPSSSSSAAPPSIHSPASQNLTSNQTKEDAPKSLLEKLGFLPQTREGNTCWSRFTARHTILILLPLNDDSASSGARGLKETLTSLPRGPYVRLIVVRPTQSSQRGNWDDLIKVCRECADGSGEVWDLQTGLGDEEVYKTLYTGGTQVRESEMNADSGIRICIVTPDARLLAFGGLEEAKGYLEMVFPWHFGSESGETPSIE